MRKRLKTVKKKTTRIINMEYVRWIDTAYITKGCVINLYFNDEPMSLLFKNQREADKLLNVIESNWVQIIEEDEYWNVKEKLM